jgi:Fis family transcriptional regulator
VSATSADTRRPAVAVVSTSPLLCRRVSKAVEEAGFEPVCMFSAKQLVTNPRRRPFLLCYIDVRGKKNLALARKCFEVRPAERYVQVRSSWTGETGDALNSKVFGCLCESFTSAEIRDWTNRALAEERFKSGGPPLEEFLYDRFSSFLGELGPSSMNSLHELVWEWVERPLLSAVMEHTGGNQSRAASLLGIHRNTLRTKLRELGLHKPGS